MKTSLHLRESQTPLSPACASARAVRNPNLRNSAMPASSIAENNRASDDRSNRILLLVTNLTFGGAEAQVVRLAVELKSRGWQVAVVSLVEPEAHMAQLANINVAVHTLSMKRRIPDPRAILRLRAILREFRPAVMHCHMFHANLLGRISRLFVPVPALVCTVHNLRETSERGGPTWYKELLYRLTDRLADSTTAICQTAFDRHVQVGAVPAGRMRVVPNFIDTDRFSPDQTIRKQARLALHLENEFVWLAVGRLVQQKDYPNLLRAIHSLGRTGVKVLIAGAGPLHGGLESMTKSLGLESQVRFFGTSEDILDLYNAADAFVMASRFEGLSVALLEASSMALPSVVTHVGGNPEIVENGASGFLGPSADSEALAAAMRGLMELPLAERLEMGRLARRHCTLHFDRRIVIERWLDLYAEARSASNSRRTPTKLSPVREVN